MKPNNLPKELSNSEAPVYIQSINEGLENARRNSITEPQTIIKNTNPTFEKNKIPEKSYTEKVKKDLNNIKIKAEEWAHSYNKK